PNFIVPSDTFEISPSIDGQYSRWGYTITGFYDYTRRTAWKPWGNLAEYNPNQKTFTNFGGSLGKSFYLPKFQRIGVDINYLDGQRLDRFSKYEPGFLGTQRVHGVRPGSVRAEKMAFGHPLPAHAGRGATRTEDRDLLPFSPPAGRRCAKRG